MAFEELARRARAKHERLRCLGARDTDECGGHERRGVSRAAEREAERGQDGDERRRPRTVADLSEKDGDGVGAGTALDRDEAVPPGVDRQRARVRQSQKRSEGGDE